MYTVLKRDGRIINFDIQKITNAIKLAFDDKLILNPGKMIEFNK